MPLLVLILLCFSVSHSSYHSSSEGRLFEINSACSFCILLLLLLLLFLLFMCMVVFFKFLFLGWHLFDRAFRASSFFILFHFLFIFLLLLVPFPVFEFVDIFLFLLFFFPLLFSFSFISYAFSSSISGVLWVLCCCFILVSIFWSALIARGLIQNAGSVATKQPSSSSNWLRRSEIAGKLAPPPSKSSN